jgi:catechol 2,3-dioxygenase-like lactoylglutathione lyase family enzyme
MEIFRILMPVSDLAHAAQFYCTLMGQPGERVSPGRHYFRAGAVILACYDAVADGDARTFRPLTTETYFAVDDLEKAYATAVTAGAHVSEQVSPGAGALGVIQVRPWGERSFYVADPFGNPLCFVDAQTKYLGSLP